MTKGKRFYWFVMSMLPLLVSIVVQLLLGFVAGLIFVFMSMLKTTDLNALSEEVMLLNQQYSPLTIFIYHILGIIGFGIWYYYLTNRRKPSNPIPSLKGLTVPFIVVLSFFLCVFASSFVHFAQYAMPKSSAVYQDMMEMAGMGTTPLTIFSSIFLAPIGEEILCRGLILHFAQKMVSDLPRKKAFWIANSLQALAFGIMHLNVIQGLYAFILGLGLGYLRIRCKSLYPAILAHAVINFLASYVIDYFLNLFDATLPNALLLMAASTILTLLCVKLYERTSAVPD